MLTIADSALAWVNVNEVAMPQPDHVEVENV